MSVSRRAITSAVDTLLYGRHVNVMSLVNVSQSACNNKCSRHTVIRTSRQCYVAS